MGVRAKVAHRTRAGGRSARRGRCRHTLRDSWHGQTTAGTPSPHPPPLHGMVRRRRRRRRHTLRRFMAQATDGGDAVATPSALHGMVGRRRGRCRHTLRASWHGQTTAGTPSPHPPPLHGPGDRRRGRRRHNLSPFSLIRLCNTAILLYIYNVYREFSSIHTSSEKTQCNHQRKKVYSIGT